jgi:hypothetical protein
MRRTEDAASPTPTSSSTIPRTRPSALTSAASPAPASTSNRRSRFETGEPQYSSWFDFLTAGCDPTGSPCREEREGDRLPVVYRAVEAPPVREEVARPPHSVGTLTGMAVPENPTSARPASARCPKSRPPTCCRATSIAGSKQSCEPIRQSSARSIEYSESVALHDCTTCREQRAARRRRKLGPAMMTNVPHRTTVTDNRHCLSSARIRQAVRRGSSRSVADASRRSSPTATGPREPLERSVGHCTQGALGPQ